MEEEEKNGDEIDTLKNNLKEIATEIQRSWLKDCDRTEYMIKLTNILKEICQKDSLEEYFSNNEELLNYFMEDFMKEVIQYILTQPVIFGDDGDNIAMELHLNIIKLFIKFHKNTKYSPLFKKIREIFYGKNNRTFLEGQDHRNENPIKKYNYAQFNKEFNSEFEKKTDKDNFQKEDEVDISIDNPHSKSSLDKKSWVRGKIKDIRDDGFIVEYCDDSPKMMSIDDCNIYPAGKKATDWEWRTNLHQYDVIDCFDRSKWSLLL